MNNSRNQVFKLKGYHLSKRQNLDWIQRIIVCYTALGYTPLEIAQQLDQDESYVGNKIKEIYKKTNQEELVFATIFIIKNFKIDPGDFCNPFVASRLNEYINPLINIIDIYYAREKRPEDIDHDFKNFIVAEVIEIHNTIQKNLMYHFIEQDGNPEDLTIAERSYIKGKLIGFTDKQILVDSNLDAKKLYTIKKDLFEKLNVRNEYSLLLKLMHLGLLNTNFMDRNSKAIIVTMVNNLIDYYKTWHLSLDPEQLSEKDVDYLRLKVFIMLKRDFVLFENYAISRKFDVF